MKQPTVVDADKQQIAAPEGVRQHTAIRSLTELAMRPVEPINGKAQPASDPVRGHDFSQVAPLTVAGPAHPSLSCSASSGRSPFGGVCQTCKSPVPQKKLKIAAPYDKYEREADRIAATIMRMPKPQTTQRLGVFDRNQTPSMNLQRDIQHQGKDVFVIPTIYNVLHSTGQPLDTKTRSFMEPRFKSNFSQVRVHTDTKAAESSEAINASAYTIGEDIVFGWGQYSPQTSVGQELIAHELTHVTQQKNHGASGQTIFRRVARRLVNCTPGTNGAPADPVAELTTVEARAQALAQASANLLTISAVLTEQGMRNPTSSVDQAYQNRFGLPPARPGGFLNRLTGNIRPTLDRAISEEMNLLARRFQLIATTFNGFIHYRCIGGASSFAGCNIPNCTSDAWTCTGVNAIFMCPTFWPVNNSNSTLLIHEAGHMIWGRVGHGARGSGGNFRHAECYASFVGDLFGIAPGGPACPAP